MAAGACIHHLLLWITLVAMVTGENKVAQVVSESQTTVANMGEMVVLTCEVENTENRPVQWWFVEHNLQISSDNDILTTADTAGHYTIIQPQGGTFPHWNLQILSMRSVDQGHYKCLIEGTSAAIISTISIRNDPNATPTPTDLPPVDFTDCCRARNVTTACLPVCNPTTMDLNSFDPRICINDLLSLLHCGADGRNHAACCRRRNLAIPCLDFCVNVPPTSLTSDLNTCLENADKVISCFQEGQHLLPSQPQKVRVTPLTSHSLYVKWERPLENWNNLTAYRVFFKRQTTSSYTSTNTQTDDSYTLDGLYPLTSYDVYISAVNAHGSSLPSYTVRASTLGSIPLVPATQTEGFPECCQHHGVSPLCQAFLCSGRPQVTTTGMSQCLSEMDKVFTCMAGERNHTSCCTLRNVPSHCSPLCAGDLRRTDLSTLDCFTKHMPSVVSCFEEGKQTLPSPPSNVVLSTVGATSVTISWEPPRSRPEKVINYLVTFVAPDKQRKQIPTQSLSLTFSDLEPSTLYTLHVSAVNDRGSSLPSPDIIFLTYYENGDILPSMPPAIVNQGPPETLEECCHAEGIKENCRRLCNYNASFSDFEVTELLECEGDIGKILMCGSGGSNHTQCCQQRGIPDQCLEFCAFDRHKLNTFSFDYAHIGCVYLSHVAQQCMSEGIVSHPTAPELVRVQNYTTNTVSLMWEKPRRLGSSTGSLQYIIRYRKPPGEQLWSQVPVPGTQRSMILQPLESDQTYYIQVIAAVGNLQSLPGPTFEVTTLPSKYEPAALIPNLNFTAPTNISVCCIKEGVKSECISVCDGYSVVKIEEVCATDLDKLLRCSADKKDHQPCCKRNNVPEECLNFCLGDGKIEHFVSMLCLSFSQEILTCFHEGNALLPSSPVDFRVVDIRSTFVVITWDKPVGGGGGGGVIYDLFYRSTAQAVYSKLHNVHPSHNLTGLQPFTKYQLFIVAENSYGNSQPSPIIDVWTLEENMPLLHVWQVPDGNIQQGTGVTLSCVSDSGPMTYIYWINNHGIEIHSEIIDFVSVNKTHTGRYTCLADVDGRKRTSNDLYLHVLYSPEVTVDQKQVSVIADRGLTARLRCQFRGFPAQVTWLKHGAVITPDFPSVHRFYHTLTTNLGTGIMTAMLEIQNVQLQDYDMYSCRGTNTLGQIDANVQLVNPNPTPTLPSFTPAPKQANVSACCIQMGVQRQCMAACTFDVDITVFSKLSNPLLCIGDLTHFVQCAADGRNHTNCCRGRNVPSRCYPFCAGIVPGNVLEYVECLQQVENIISCMEYGAEVVPSPPRNVKAQLTEEGYIDVWWDEPAVNADKVQYFYVIYKGPDNHEQKIKVEENKREIVLAGIHSNMEYEVYLEAHNHHGSSQNSNHVYITTIQFSPSPPQNLHGSISAWVNVRLSWDRPDRHPGSVTGYVISYRPTGNPMWSNVTAKFLDTRYYLENLESGTAYQIKVFAKSSTHLSLDSNIIIIKTEVSPAPRPHKDRRGPNNIGLILTISLLLIFLIIVFIIIAVLCFRSKRNTDSNGYKESVSFENPGYTTAAEARVSGLPNFKQKHRKEAESSNSDRSPITPDFKGSAIMRETDHGDGHSDQGYSTLSPSTDLTPASTPTSNTATMDVTQINPLESNQIDLEEVASKL